MAKTIESERTGQHVRKKGGIRMNTIIELLFLPIVCVLSVIAGLMEME